MVYTENIQFVWVESIAAEYNEVAWHTAAGNTPAINCEPSSINHETPASSIALFPNPVREVISLQTIEMIDKVIFFNLQGQIQKEVNNGAFF